MAQENMDSTTIRATLALREQAHRQSLIQVAGGSPYAKGVRNGLLMLGAFLVALGTGLFVETDEQRWVWAGILMALLASGLASWDAHRNERRLDAIVELLNVKELPGNHRIEKV